MQYNYPNVILNLDLQLSSMSIFLICILMCILTVKRCVKLITNFFIHTVMIKFPNLISLKTSILNLNWRGFKLRIKMFPSSKIVLMHGQSYLNKIKHINTKYRFLLAFPIYWFTSELIISQLGYLSHTIGNNRTFDERSNLIYINKWFLI